MNSHSNRAYNTSESRSLRRLFVVCVLGFLWVPSALAQVSDQEAKSLAESMTRAAVGYPNSKPLRLRRREDLEDELFVFQRKPLGKIQKAAYFYEVSTQGYFVISPSEAVYVDSADGQSLHMVAVSVSSGKTYGLFGFNDAAAQFSRLAETANLTVNTPKDAERYATLFFTALMDASGNRGVSSARDLKHKVENYFFSSYSDKKAERLYRLW